MYEILFLLLKYLKQFYIFYLIFLILKALTSMLYPNTTWILFLSELLIEYVLISFA